LFKHHTIEMYMVHGGRAPHLLDLSTR